MQKIVSLAKRRGFIFQGSEIYGGLAGTYDYGPLGSLLKNNIKDSWLKKFVHSRTDMYLVDAAILMNQNVWRSTGHVDHFSDPLVEDLKTKKRYRADNLIEDNGLSALGLTPKDMTDLINEKGILSPDGNKLGEVRQFNMMLQTKLGAVEDSSATSYLRPETAQGIFVNFKNVVDSMNPKMPFGISQIGKAFRNEITPRDFIFRLRELEQMEIEYFVKPSEWKENFEYWKDEMMEWMESVGLDMNKVHPVEIGDGDRAHYSARTIDFEFEYPFGQKELYGLAYRGDFDLSRHAEGSTQKLQYVNQSEDGTEVFVPHVIEPSFGLDRTVLAILTSAYREDTLGDESRVYLALNPKIAPYKIAVSPLLKNKTELVEKAKDLFGVLKSEFGNVVFDDNGNIGKRYRRQDEIGTPFCIVVDFETLEDEAVTVRFRDTGAQERVKIVSLVAYFKEKLS
ncbi:MAG: glycyl-tRNA synthetase [Patescibacteria group bacterium]|nr:glycyl-tRNA synthetase [Patescibacteria group bacterium]